MEAGNFDDEGVMDLRLRTSECEIHIRVHSGDHIHTAIKEVLRVEGCCFSFMKESVYSLSHFDPDLLQSQ